MRTRQISLAVLVALVVGACASSGGLTHPPSRYGAPSPEAAVRGFLDALQTEDYERMARHFGTREGPAEEEFGIAHVEQRMVILGGLLQHESYELRRENLSALGPERTRFVAVLRGTREGRLRVPVISVSTPDGRWFVERVAVDELETGSG